MRKPSPPLVLASAALFFAIGGPSFAADATSAARKLITGKQIKDGSIGEKDLDKKVRAKLAAGGKAGPAGATGAQGPQGPGGAQGEHGLAGADGRDGTDATLPPVENWHEIGPFTGTKPDDPPPGEFLCGKTNCAGQTEWSNWAPVEDVNTAGFMKDRDGFVHLKGVVKRAQSEPGSSMVFRLPPGYRPAKLERHAVVPGGHQINVAELSPDGLVQILNHTSGVAESLDGIVFRAAG